MSPGGQPNPHHAECPCRNAARLITMTVTDKAVSNIVGMDIGCGMYTVHQGMVKIDMEQMEAAA